MPEQCLKWIGWVQTRRCFGPSTGTRKAQTCRAKLNPPVIAHAIGGVLFKLAAELCRKSLGLRESPSDWKLVTDLTINKTVSGHTLVTNTTVNLTSDLRKSQE